MCFVQTWRQCGAVGPWAAAAAVKQELPAAQQGGAWTKKPNKTTHPAASGKFLRIPATHTKHTPTHTNTVLEKTESKHSEAG